VGVPDVPVKEAAVSASSREKYVVPPAAKPPVKTTVPDIVSVLILVNVVVGPSYPLADDGNEEQ